MPFKEATIAQNGAGGPGRIFQSKGASELQHDFRTGNGRSAIAVSKLKRTLHPMSIKPGAHEQS